MNNYFYITYYTYYIIVLYYSYYNYYDPKVNAYSNSMLAVNENFGKLLCHLYAKLIINFKFLQL